MPRIWAVDQFVDAANEQAWRTEAEVREGLLALWKVMDACIDRGCRTEGIMPGGLKVKRRAAQLYRQLKTQGDSLGDESLNTMDWVTLYALAVNEENAVGGRIVTAPTNGAAGNYSRCAQVLPAPLPWRERRGRLPLFTHRRRHRHPL